MKKLLLGCGAVITVMTLSQLAISWMDSHPPIPTAYSPVASEATSPSSPVANEVPVVTEDQPVEVEFSLTGVGFTDHSKVVYERPTTNQTASAVVAGQ